MQSMHLLTHIREAFPLANRVDCIPFPAPLTGDEKMHRPANERLTMRG